jgi:hypothetical protein
MRYGGAIAIYDVVAWFLLWLTYLGREFNEKRSLFFLRGSFLEPDPETSLG